jgi:hypothetical protein
LYATATAIAEAYTFPVRLRYIVVAYRNFCTPQKTIPPIAIFLVVSPGGEGQATSSKSRRRKTSHQELNQEEKGKSGASHPH